jgi:CubicO group peptidase (beta-lactamase class C family)
MSVVLSTFRDMRIPSLLIIAGAVLVACASPEVRPGPEAASPRTGDEELEVRLTPLVPKLVKPRLGTAGVISAASGPRTSTVSAGVLWDEGPSADEATYFNVASVSKLLTAARVVSLAHEGVISLDDALVLHLPGVALVDTSGTNRSDTITIRDLLRHRSGLPHVPADLEHQVANRWTDPLLLTKITESWSISLASSPGQYRYSNFGYALLGAIVERKKSRSFADCMTEYLAELEMTRSTFWPANLDENAAHGRVSNNGETAFNEPGWYGSRYALPFSGLWTTMPDLVAFGKVLLASVDAPTAPLFAMTTGEGHGLGPVHGNRLGTATLEHDGSSPGFKAALVVIPAKQIVVALATNGGNEAADEVQAFSQIVDEAVVASAME